MAKAIEETLKKCTNCKRKTKHIRNITKSSSVMILVHIALTLVTMGVWLVLLLIWTILNAKVGGWTCSECG